MQCLKKVDFLVELIVHTTDFKIYCCILLDRQNDI